MHPAIVLLIIVAAMNPWMLNVIASAFGLLGLIVLAVTGAICVLIYWRFSRWVFAALAIMVGTVVLYFSTDPGSDEALYLWIGGAIAILVVLGLLHDEAADQ